VARKSRFIRILINTLKREIKVQMLSNFNKHRENHIILAIIQNPKELVFTKPYVSRVLDHLVPKAVYISLQFSE
jgi:transposase